MRDEWSGLSASAQISQLQRHRLLPLALAHARRAGAELGPLLSGMWESLLATGRRNTQLNRALLDRVLPALNARGCHALLLKGVALGQWLYPEPELRSSSDIDLLIDARHRLSAHAALTTAGLRSDGYSQHDHASQQATYHDPETDRYIDLHWALNVLPEISCRFDFAELDAESIELPALPGARAFCRKHALMHAVVHFHAHLPANERPAVWLYDMVLLAQGLDSAGWAELDASVRKAGLAGLHADALRRAAHWFPLDLPEDLLQQWQALGQGECASHLLKPENSAARRLVHSLGCVPTLSGRIAYLRARLFPAVEWMRGRYATQSHLQLAKAYLRRWTSGLRQTLDAQS